jgi:hypothetical protein
MLPEEAHDLLLQLKGEMSQRDLIAEIESRYGIGRLITSRLSEFFAWLSERRALRRMKDDAAAFRENFGAANPEATLEEAHEAALSSLLLRAIREDKLGLMRFVLSEIRRARALTQSDEKVEIMERRVAVIERRLAPAIPEAPLTPEERMQRIKQVFGIR